MLQVTVGHRNSLAKSRCIYGVSILACFTTSIRCRCGYTRGGNDVNPLTAFQPKISVAATEARIAPKAAAKKLPVLPTAAAERGGVGKLGEEGNVLVEAMYAGLERMWAIASTIEIEPILPRK